MRAQVTNAPLTEMERIEVRIAVTAAIQRAREDMACFEQIAASGDMTQQGLSDLRANYETSMARLESARQKIERGF